MQKSMRRIMTLAVLVLAFGAISNAKAGELFTPPIITDQQAVFFTCAVTNLRKAQLEITTQEIDENGDVLEEQTVLLEPGFTHTQGGIRNGPYEVHRCIFKFKGSDFGVLGTASASHCTVGGPCLAETFAVVVAQPLRGFKR